MKAATSSPISQVYTFKVLWRQLEAMKRIQTQTGTSVSEQIRRGVDLWLKQQEKSR